MPSTPPLFEGSTQDVQACRIACRMLRDQLRLEDYKPKYRMVPSSGACNIFLKGGTTVYMRRYTQCSLYLRVRGTSAPDVRAVTEIATLCGWTVLAPGEPDPS